MEAIFELILGDGFVAFSEWKGYSSALFIGNILFVIAISALILLVTKKIFARLIRLGKKKEKSNVTALAFLSKIVQGLIYFLAAASVAYQVPALRSVVVSLLAGSGVIALALGLASQEAFSNVVSGLFISIFTPFKIGDFINYSTLDVEGYVEDITLRHTVIRTFENRRLVIPNGLMNKEIIENSNFNDNKIHNRIDFTISYESDVKLAKKILQEKAEAHPYCLDGRSAKEHENNIPIVQPRLTAWTNIGLTLSVWVWSRDNGSGFAMRCELYESVLEEFNKQGVLVPHIAPFIPLPVPKKK